MRQNKQFVRHILPFIAITMLVMTQISALWVPAVNKGITIEICTANGLGLITLPGTDDNPQKEKKNYCSMCMASHTKTIEAAQASLLNASNDVVVALILQTNDFIPSSLHNTLYRPRDPPQIS